MPETSLRIGRWTFLPEAHLLKSNGIERHLEPKQAEVLLRLAANPGAVVSKSDLLDTVWGDVCVTEEVLTNAIYQLRRAFGDSARTQQYVQTIPKKGYRLVADVVSLPESNEQRARAGRWRALASIAVVAAALIFVPALLSQDDSRHARALVERGEAALERGVASSDADALRIFEEAVESDPQLSAAWSGLAAARWALVSGGEVSGAVGLPIAEQAATRAIELDPALSHPWTTLGLVHAARWEWEEAESALTRAIELDPASANAHSRYAELLLLTGRGDEARSEIETALDLAPSSRKVLRSAGFIYGMLRDAEPALRAYRTILSLDPGDAEARNQIEKLTTRDSFPSGPELTAGKIDQLLKKRHLRPAVVAGMFAEAGEDDRAIEWLRRARAEKDLSLLLVRLDDRWARLHGDDRFRAILDDVGF